MIFKLSPCRIESDAESLGPVVRYTVDNTNFSGNNNYYEMHIERKVSSVRTICRHTYVQS